MAASGGAAGTGGSGGAGGPAARTERRQRHGRPPARAERRRGGHRQRSATIVPDPSWTCGLPDGIPPPTAGTLALSVALTVSANHDVGNTQFGRRRQLDVSGGTITGHKLKGTVLTGGLDFELTLSTGAMELEEVLVWRTSDNVTIFTRLCGVAAAGDSVVRIVPASRPRPRARMLGSTPPSSSARAWSTPLATRLCSTSTTYPRDRREPKVQLKIPRASPTCRGTA